ncbi:MULTISPECIES: FixH family protein [Mycolicibacterium]|uniref:YtkA-like domain-containing protein n=1 Tax=Mycolicibacterium wolinskyi TaxID=59750 RepID=A0A1X2F9U3_9MYCO|nr:MULTISPECIES: FixH family protein [Mycolicibacterium]MCV7290462.1 FixH family protein [Mycolicibacterium wolinskyi]MCV7297022.1 FixH family protein [Mycolicibacterium goodii]ORX15177.1 hypothetical protein AWC31_24425 [Mycolicibacterium wolinskyi]
MSRQRLLVTTVVVVAVAAGVGWLLWPTSAAPSAAAVTAGPYQVRLIGDPPKVGTGPVTVEITGSGDEAPTPDTVSFEPAMPQMGHATTPVVATAEGDGRYRGDVDLSMPGQWEITVRITSGTQTHNAVFSVTTNG